LDVNGKVIASSDTSNTGKDLSETDYFLNGRKAVYVSDIFREEETGRITWLVSCPVMDVKGDRLLAVLASRINPVTLSDITTECRIRALGAKSQALRTGETGETYIVNRDNLMITESRSLSDVILKQVVDTEIVRCTRKVSETKAVNYPDYRGVPVDGASMVIWETGWIIISETDFKEAIIPFQRLLNLSLAGIGVLIPLIFFVSWILSQKLTVPIMRLIKANRAVTQGDLANAYIPDQEIPADEIGEVMRSRNKMLNNINGELSKLSAAIGQSVNLICITDVKGKIEYVNATFEKITGYSRVEVIGQNTRILQSGEASQPVYEELWNTILAGETWRGSFKNKKKNGQYYHCETIIIPMRDEKGQITSFLCVQEDITEKLELKKDACLAASYASFDGLTGLYNRTRFMELLEVWLFQAKAHKYEGALLMIDIDRFRQINDTYGNKVGDDLLKRIADFLKDGIDEADMRFFLKASEKAIMESLLCRMGGDEFAIFLPSRTEQEAVMTADEIRKKLESFQFGDWTGHITISVGIVIYPLHGSTLYDLLKKADAAVYSSKELGRNRVHLYHPDDMVLEQMHSRVEGKGRIQKAIRDDRFETWYQPILELKNDTITHYEALVRMRNEDMSIVNPGKFITIAESLGLIMDIDRIIIEKTLRFRQNLLKQGKDLYFSMNLSAKDMNDQAFRLFLMETMTAAKEDASHLIFEITETVAIHDLDRAVKFIRELKTTGCKFSLDDFGVGFTSFRYLQEMDVDYIKIDGAFIKKLPESRNDRLFVKSMVDVAHGLWIQTVAEFVENEATIRVLRELGVDYAQGYFIGKPAPDVL